MLPPLLTRRLVLPFTQAALGWLGLCSTCAHLAAVRAL